MFLSSAFSGHRFGFLAHSCFGFTLRSQVLSGVKQLFSVKKQLKSHVAAASTSEHWQAARNTTRTKSRRWINVTKCTKSFKAMAIHPPPIHDKKVLYTFLRNNN